VGFMSVGPLPDFVYCAVNSLIRINAVWSIIKVEMAF
jgi:hypothetical protein